MTLYVRRPPHSDVFSPVIEALFERWQRCRTAAQKTQLVCDVPLPLAGQLVDIIAQRAQNELTPGQEQKRAA